MIPATEALERLCSGNRRFVAGTSEAHPAVAHERRAALVGGQEPFAVVLGCSDSRVPVELVFDAGPGELFVVRVAGNIVSPSQTGSVEFAVEQFRTRLVLVLGHTRCGAVLAALKDLRRPAEDRSPGLRSIVELVRPAIEPLLAQPAVEPDALAGHAVRANVIASVAALGRGSPVLAPLAEKGELLVVGAVYSLETGEVELVGAS